MIMVVTLAFVFAQCCQEFFTDLDKPEEGPPNKRTQNSGIPKGHPKLADGPIRFP